MASNIKKRIYESLASELTAFIYDKRIVEHGEVSEIISRDPLLKKYLRSWVDGNIVVWYVDMKSLENRCKYSCGGISNPKEYTHCVVQCKYSELEKLKTEIMENLNNLREHNKMHATETR